MMLVMRFIGFPGHVYISRIEIAPRTGGFHSALSKLGMHIIWYNISLLTYIY